MFDSSGKDLGYQPNKDWWFNGPNAFRIAKLDDDYPAHYFTVAGVPDSVVEAYCKYVPEYYEKITGEKLETIIEYGSAGGWFTDRFEQLGYMIHSVEGSKYGRFHEKADLRNVFFTERLSDSPYHDIALCSEVAEHLEPPFAGILVHNLTCESNVIWWSAATDEGVQPHLHHPNAQPLEYWKAIFAFHNYGCYMLPDEVYEACATRGRCIFYNKEVYQL